MASIAVIGAGAVGLSTALQIAETLPRCELKVLADKVGADTTSHGAAGNFHPDTIAFSKDVSRLHRWFGRSFDRYSQLLFSDEGYEAGISMIPFIYLMEKSRERLEFMDNYVFNLRSLKPETIARMNLPSRYTAGSTCDTFLLESRYYLPFLQKKLAEHNVAIETRRVTSVKELSREVDLIVNCSGLASRKLFNDDKMYPVRGQVVRVRAPWIKHAYMGLDHTYVFPTRESVVLGGTAQINDESVEVREAETQDILERTYQLLPSLRHATIVEQWAGLRPGRDELRLEIDNESCGVPVVHNYGHGAKGIALSHGTAVEAASLVHRALRASKL